MTHRGIGPAFRDCKSWYFLGMFLWIGIIVFIILFAGGFGEVPPAFIILLLLFFTIIGISALILFSIRTFRQNPKHHKNTLSQTRQMVTTQRQKEVVVHPNQSYNTSVSVRIHRS